MNLSRQLARRAFAPLCVLACAALVACSQKPNAAGGAAKRGDVAVPVDVRPVEIVGVDRTLPVVGTLFAKDEATLGAEVEGKLEKTLVDFGDRVKAGQELASIDTASYEALAHQASANLAKARATADNAEKELKRVEALGGSASPSDRDQAASQA